MARSARSDEFWTGVVSEVRAGLATHDEIAAKHGVTPAALKYHFYKSREVSKGRKSPAMLPVRVSGTPSPRVEVELSGGLRVQFVEGCDPAYVAALVAKLR